MGYYVSQNDLTIYTNGEDPTKYRFQDNLEMALARGCRLDTRKILSLSRMPDDTVVVHFEHGAINHLGFLMHSPPTRNRAEYLISQLGVETAGAGGYAMVKGAFGETNVRGCFVGGDTSSLTKTIAAALNSGMDKIRALQGNDCKANMIQAWWLVLGQRDSWLLMKGGRQFIPSTR